MPTLEGVSRLHLIGIGGVGMSGIAFSLPDTSAMLGTFVLISPEMKYFFRSGSSICFSDWFFFDISSSISSAGMKPLSQ